MSATPDYPFRSPTALEPPEEWARLREKCPVSPICLASGDEAVLLTRYDDVKDLLSDPRFTRHLDAPDAAKVATTSSGGAFAKRRSGMAASVGEGHQRWRRLVGRAFTVKRMTSVRPRMEKKTRELVGAMTAAGPPADLVSGVGFPLPVWVICELIGVPEKDRYRFPRWADTFMSMTKHTQEEVDSSQEDFTAYLAAHIAVKKAEPGDDLISDLLALSDESEGGDEGGGGLMTEATVLGTCQSLLVAGHETTANMIGKMVAMLLADRRRWERVLADRSLVRSAVEEVLRFDANPGVGMPRYVTEEIEISGTVIKPGTTVMCSTGSANRDGEAFEHADELDVTRSPNAHLAFGVGGYSCVGQALARTELQVVLSVLLDELPSLDLAVPAEKLPRREGLLVGGLQELPVTW
ncbi:cytochrome P450 [Nonomuraea rhizosphaerae]|uniref:cytochrome P450 n=1 Tax=Nonomuraea rhizosphaerae TaxID=2665663 RepID=UPI0027E26518|nr:cytochrome P450 [Nonomuraea rhizosphaerae]